MYTRPQVEYFKWMPDKLQCWKLCASAHSQPSWERKRRLQRSLTKKASLQNPWCSALRLGRTSLQVPQKVLIIPGKNDPRVAEKTEVEPREHSIVSHTQAAGARTEWTADSRTPKSHFPKQHPHSTHVVFFLLFYVFSNKYRTTCCRKGEGLE